MGQAVNPANH